MHRTLLFLFALSLCTVAYAQDSYKITVNIEGYDQEMLTLANNILDKQYLVDTAYRADNGSYVFSSDTSSLPAGIYLVVTQPDNSYFQILVNEGKQILRFKTQVDDLGAVEAIGDKDNQLFYEYLAYLDQQQKTTAPVQKMLADSTITEAQRTKLTKAMSLVDKEVKAFQDRLTTKNPHSFTAAIINTNRPLPPPDFSELASEEARYEAQFRWLQEHYFDPIDLKDERLLRTPFLIQRLDYFVDRLHVQHPDSISIAIDKVLGKMNQTGEMFKYYVVHFTNKSAASNIVGMDAVYVHMVDNYYSNGRAYWANEEQLATMKKNADENRPLLIGKQAPDIQMKTRDGKDVSLYDVDAKYTILYFWAYDCGHCKKSTPLMSEFYQKWKDKGVEIFSICTKQSEIQKCWDYIDEKKIADWMHVTDKYLRFYKDYNIKSTPTIFVLDENKEIISKRLGAEQLDDLLTRFEQMKAGETANGK